MPDNSPTQMSKNTINQIYSVLFCCDYNAMRSPMAEGILKHYGGSRYFCDSCGVVTQATDPFILQISDEIGVDLHHHVPKSFDNLQDSSFDIIVALSENSYSRSLKFSQNMACKVVCWDVCDPSIIEGDRDSILQAYRKLRDQLVDKIQQYFCSDSDQQP